MLSNVDEASSLIAHEWAVFMELNVRNEAGSLVYILPIHTGERFAPSSTRLVIVQDKNNLSSTMPIVKRGKTYTTWNKLMRLIRMERGHLVRMQGRLAAGGTVWSADL